MDAMSDAIEGADVMLYGVSLRYKESANVSGSRCHGLEAERAAADPDSRSCMIGGICRAVRSSVPTGGELRSPARAGHDPTDDAEGLQASGLA